MSMALARQNAGNWWRNFWSHWQYSTLMNFVLFSSSLCFLLLSIWLNVDGLGSLNPLLTKISSPSPVLTSVKVPIVPKHVDITLLMNQNPSTYRQEPSHEVDIAWEDLGDLRLIPLTRDEVVNLGKDPDAVVRFPETFGVGKEAYAGRLDVFHQVHCLDALRREAYFEHYYGKQYPGGWNDTTQMHRLHLSHCIEYLLESILCQATTDVYTHVWTDGVEHPFPDFRNDRRCRDYSTIKKWQGRNAVDVDEFIALRAPEGAKILKMTREFKDLHGYFKVHADNGQHGDQIL